MVCKFLENLSLASLLAPFPEEEFRALYWEQKPLTVHRSDPAFYSGLFSLQAFDQAIGRSPDYVKLANATTSKNQSYGGNAAEGLEAMLADMRAGGTLVLDQLHHREPNLSLLCRTLAAELGHRFQTNLYLTPPNGKGFSPHWDNHDVFILQVMGSKHWKIEQQRRTMPGKEDKMGDDGRDLRGPIDSFVLEQGDLIYIPRGFVHAAECGTESSLHITLGVTAVFWEDLLCAAIRAATLEDERLRRALPLGFTHTPREVLAKRLRGALREMSDESFLSKAVDQFLDELVRTHKLDVTTQVLEFFQAKQPVTLDTIAGVRRGAVYRMHASDESVRLFYGARSIVFPPFFRAALECALRQPSFAVRDLPGELQDEERVAFAERLLEEGLIVRPAGAGSDTPAGTTVSYA